MNAAATEMKVTIAARGPEMLDRLRDRLAQAALLRCAEHGQPVLAVTIHARENGWFETMWTTCCEALERDAAAIVKSRC